jgi:hypothetical protein
MITSGDLLHINPYLFSFGVYCFHMREIGVDHLEVTDFTLGMLNVMDEMSPGHILNARDRSVDKAFEDASNRLVRLVDAGEVEPLHIRFRIVTHPIHGDSPLVYDSMSFLYSLGYIEQVRGQYYRFNRGKHADAEEFHEAKRIPGSIDTYRRLASRFVSITSGVSVEEVI